MTPGGITTILDAKARRDEEREGEFLFNEKIFKH
jgi:hypothetical protein